MTEKSKRSVERASRRYKVRLQQFVCFTANVSDGGFCAVSNRVLAPGTAVEGTIEIDGASVPFRGTVAWARAGDARLGIFGRMGIRFAAGGLAGHGLPPAPGPAR